MRPSSHSATAIDAPSGLTAGSENCRKSFGSTSGRIAPEPTSTSTSRFRPARFSTATSDEPSGVKAGDLRRAPVVSRRMRSRDTSQR
jgi:hypothetical protein